MAMAPSVTCGDRETAQNILDKMFNNSTFSDVTFVVNGVKFYASRIHMIAASEVFQAMFIANTNENNIISIPNIEYEESFELTLGHIYGKKIDFSQLKKGIVCEILTIAEHYHLPNLSKLVVNFLNHCQDFTQDGVILLFNTAKIYKMHLLYMKAMCYIVNNAKEMISRDETFNKLNYDALRDLLEDDKLHATCTEIELLKMTLDWINASEKINNSKDGQLKDYIKPLLKNIKFSIIPTTKCVNLFSKNNIYYQYEYIVSEICREEEEQQQQQELLPVPPAPTSSQAYFQINPPSWINLNFLNK